MSTYRQPTFWDKTAELIAKWRDDPRQGDTFLFVMSLIVGLVMGLLSLVFRWLIYQSHHLFHDEEDSILHTLPTAIEDAVIIFLPAIGGLIVGLLIYKFLKLGGGHGVPSVMKAVATGQVNLSPSMAIKSATAPITITSGGSSGPEGPIVEIGAVVGSVFGTWSKVRKEHVATLVGCGAAAGISAMFGAPIGGVIFALELIMRDFQVRKFAPIVVSAVMASVTVEALIVHLHLPNASVFEPLSDQTLNTIQPSAMLIVQFTILGVGCALIGSLLVWSLYKFHDIFQFIKKIPMCCKPMIGGLCVGIIGLYSKDILGEGYGSVNDLILSVHAPAVTNVLLISFLIICVLKVLATSLTLGSGGTGGTFAPAMVCGAFVGASIGLIAETIMPSFSPDYRVFAMVGMAGVVSSAMGTPLAALLIIYEIAGGRYRLVLPLMITVAVSALVSSVLRSGTVYTITLLRDGFDVDAHQSRPRDPLENVVVSELMSTEFTSFRSHDTLDHIMNVVVDTEEDAFVVTDEKNNLKGVISTNDLRAVATLGELGAAAVIAGDIADTNPPSLTKDSSASEALDIFSNSDIEGIPVVEEVETRKRVMGMIYRGDVLRAYKQRASSSE